MTDLTLLEESLDALKLTKNDRLLLAFSAGPDSTALLAMLKALGFANISLAYVNYHDSPYVSDEEALVRKCARAFKVPLYRDDVDSAKLAPSNFERWAREYRYAYFQSLVRTHGFKGILVAHHLDDLIETYLIQKSRNSLVTHYGLMAETTIMGIDVYRPLLKYTKADLIAYLKKNNISYYDDVTNTNLNRLRNRIRRYDLPTVDRDLILQEIEVKNDELKATYELLEILLKDDNVNRRSYRQLAEDTKKRLLYSLIAKHLPLRSDKTINKLSNKCYHYLKRSGTGSLYLIDDYYLYLDQTDFSLSPYRAKGGYSYLIERPGVYTFEHLTIDLTVDGIFNVFPYSYPLTIRPAIPGDRISTKLKTKNVRHFIKSQKVPSYLRDLYPVILDKMGHVIYVPFYSDLENNLIPLKLRLIES